MLVDMILEFAEATVLYIKVHCTAPRLAQGTVDQHHMGIRGIHVGLPAARQCRVEQHLRVELHQLLDEVGGFLAGLTLQKEKLFIVNPNQQKAKN